MKKIDLHIHTVKTISDSYFKFSIEKLEEYVSFAEIDCIAITNHNMFNKHQFEQISNKLNILVLPGIEINLEDGHLLLISENSELDDFSSKCNEIQNSISNADDSILTKDLQRIFVDLSKYLLIPHYLKNKPVKQTTLSKISDYISAGEVSSVKKFIYCLKNKESLTPLYFSDIRIDEELVEFPLSQTYLVLDEISLNGIKHCLTDKNKVCLTKQDGRGLFQVLGNGLEISTGLNVMLGGRSSGKTYTLKAINKNFSNAKYIQQFSLLETDEDAAKRDFADLLSTRQSSITEDYLKEFREVVDDIIRIDSEQELNNIEEYIESLLKNAMELEKADSFSQATLFHESKFPEIGLGSLRDLINAVSLLIDNSEYKVLINRHISLESLKLLAIELMSKFTEELETSLKKSWINELTSNIKDGLQMRTASTSIKEVDLYKFAINRVKLSKFNFITESVRREKVIETKGLQNFSIVAKSRKFSGALELKSQSGKKIAFSGAFQVYEEPYEFLQKLKEINEIADTTYYKYFTKIQYQILNEHGYEVSGGERSEFNLLQEINNAMQYDILLIDEPESSFDNLFLKNGVNDLLKQISEEMPVVIVTHNNVVGASIKPDYLIYTKRKVEGSEVKYQIFFGYPTDKQLRSLDGEIIRNHEIVLDCLEAGEEAYIERGESYGLLED